MNNKKVATLNVPAMWLPIPGSGMNVRVYKSSFPYQLNGSLGVASDDKPVFRYAMNFVLDGLAFSLCLFTDDQSKTKVGKYFKHLSEKLTKQDVGKALVTATSSSFTYLEESYGDRN